MSSEEETEQITPKEAASVIPKLPRPFPRFRNVFDQLRDDLLLAAYDAPWQIQLGKLLAGNFDHRVNLTLEQLKRAYLTWDGDLIANLQRWRWNGLTTIPVFEKVDPRTQEPGIFFRMPYLFTQEPSTHLLLDQPLTTCLPLPFDYERRVLRHLGVLNSDQKMVDLVKLVKAGEGAPGSVYYPPGSPGKERIGGLVTNLAGVLAEVDLEPPPYTCLWIDARLFVAGLECVPKLPS